MKNMICMWSTVQMKSPGMYTHGEKAQLMKLPKCPYYLITITLTDIPPFLISAWMVNGISMRNYSSNSLDLLSIGLLEPFKEEWDLQRNLKNDKHLLLFSQF